jgi:hypothetical protein
VTERLFCVYIYSCQFIILMSLHVIEGILDRVLSSAASISPGVQMSFISKVADSPFTLKVSGDGVVLSRDDGHEYRVLQNFVSEDGKRLSDDEVRGKNGVKNFFHQCYCDKCDEEACAYFKVAVNMSDQLSLSHFCRFNSEPFSVEKIELLAFTLFSIDVKVKFTSSRPQGHVVVFVFQFSNLNGDYRAYGKEYERLINSSTSSFFEGWMNNREQVEIKNRIREALYVWILYPVGNLGCKLVARGHGGGEDIVLICNDTNNNIETFRQAISDEFIISLSDFKIGKVVKNKKVFESNYRKEYVYLSFKQA